MGHCCDLWNKGHRMGCPGAGNSSEEYQEIRRLDALVISLAAERDAAWKLIEDLVASLPKCDRHTDRPATRAWNRGGERYCEECGTAREWETGVPEYPRAAPIRAIEAARKART